jgi:hypothetical protein
MVLGPFIESVGATLTTWIVAGAITTWPCWVVTRTAALRELGPSQLCVWFNGAVSGCCRSGWNVTPS